MPFNAPTEIEVSISSYVGVWDSSSGEYPPAAVRGGYYVVSNSGVLGGVNFRAGDYLIYNGTTWDKVDNQRTPQLNYSSDYRAYLVVY